MNVFDRIKALCDENKTSIKELEKELGYSNGSLAKAKVIPSDRILDISERFSVSMNYLMTGKDFEYDYSDESALLVAKIRRDTELSKAMQKYFELSDAKKKHVVELINLLSEG